MSSRHAFKTCIQDVFKTCIQDVFKTCLQHAFKTSSRRLQDQQIFTGLVAIMKFNKTRVIVPLRYRCLRVIMFPCF